MSEQLDTPTIIKLEAAGDTIVRLTRGELATGAVAWKVRYDVSGGSSWNVTELGAALTYTASGLTPNTGYIFQVCAVGDGTDYTDSDWSASSSVTTLSARTGKFYTWEADTVFAKPGKKAQDVLFRAKVKEIDTTTILPAANVESIRLTVRKVLNSSVNQVVETVEGYDGVLVPTTAFLASADTQGYNFKYIPDQRVFPLFGEAGRYEVQFDVSVANDNPVQILYQDIVVS